MPPEITIEQVAANLAKATELIEKAQTRADSEKAHMREYVETLVKDAMQARAGTSKTMEFDIGPASREKDILRKLPSDYQRNLDNAFLLGKILNRPVQETKYWNDEVRPQLGDIHKALATASGKGTEWVPTDFSNQLWEFVRLETKIAQQYPNVPMPTPSYTLPVQLGRIMTYTHAEQTADTGQTLTTLGDPSSFAGNVTLVAKDHVGAVIMSKNIEEDSIIDLMPMVQQDIITGLAEGREDAILNGDTTVSHQDSDSQTTGDRRSMFLGLRASAIDNSQTTDLSTLTEITVHNLRGSMGKYGTNPANLFWVVSLQGYIRLMNLKLVQSLDKYGPGATILTGELGKMFGIPVIVSEWVREDLNSSGIYASGQTNTVIHLCYKRGRVLGIRRNAEVQVLRELYARSRQDAIQVTERVAFNRSYPTGQYTDWMGINVQLA
jgi:HK97 family phage major capsid protein